jgi:MvaI/BcnI restriction endonuclease family
VANGDIGTAQDIIARSAIFDQDFVSIRNGNTGIGMTLERTLGIAENNRQEADVHKTELKAKRDHTTSLTTLFTKSPHRYASLEAGRKLRGAVRGLVDAYGYMVEEDGTPRLNLYATIRGEVIVAERVLRVAITDRNLVLMIDGQPVALWFEEDLRKAFTKVEHSLALIKAKTTLSEGQEVFRFTQGTIYAGAEFDTFLALIEQGVVTVDLRARYKGGKFKDHGTAFRIHERDFSTLYTTSIAV